MFFGLDNGVHLTGGTSGDRHDAIDPAVRRRIADDDGVVVVVRQLVGGRESLPYSSPDRSNELLILRIKPVDEGPELGLRRKFPAIGFHCHGILPVALSSSALDPPNDPSSATRRTGRVDCNHSAMAGFAAAHGYCAWPHRDGWEPVPVSMRDQGGALSQRGCPG